MAQVAAPERQVLNGRDFLLFWAGQTVSKAGSAVTTVALPLVVIQALDADAFTMGLLGVAIWLPWLLLGLQAGAVADRVRKRPLMIGCDVAGALLFISVPVAAWFGVLTMAHVLLVAFLTGCAAVLFTAAYSAYVPFLVGRDQLLGANSRLQISEQGANVAGPGIGGVIAQVTGAVAGLFVDAMSFVVSAICLRSIRAVEPEAEPRPQRRIRADVVEALRFVLVDPYLRVLALHSGAVNLCMAGLQALWVLFLVRTAGLGGWVVGALTAAIAVGGVLGATLAPWYSRTLGSARALRLGSPVTALFGLLFPLANPGIGIVLALVGVFISSAGIAANSVIAISFRQAYCPREMLGRVAMSIRFVIFGVNPIGALLGGVLGTVLDVRTAIWVLVVATILAGFTLYIGPMRTGRDLPVPSKEEI
ncbi:MFS transporter [Actinokineospora globicatena]|uniref:MFS transporter n=1 Tax=Actinokineospora globicatena TaxID=103729 RepID=UPI0020A3D1BD|nr:MFS transporter [Actinokineospora globicatena]MCP2303544.1 putative arabinose efflux permease, MFS family [Actinokineospora globicatena]GLW79319.1 MFS transporter [Actinokineospora globicatena]GLW86271.1 MFS transporter [Actinokineospora globicatena]